jgi:group I intron endonuclease
MSSGIYAIINKINNKRYIGQSRHLEQRKEVHFQKLRLNKHINPHLQNAYNLYGAHNFEFIILQECPEEQLDYYEDYYINKYNTLTEGYNICEGGLNNCPDNTNEKHGMWRKDIPNELIKTMYLSGKQSSELAEIFGCSRRTIERRIHKLFDENFIKKTAIKRRSKALTGKKGPQGNDNPLFNKDVPDGEHLLKEIEAGANQTEMAKKYNVSQATISDRIVKYKKTHKQHIRRNPKKTKLWDNAVVGYRKADMFRRGKIPNPCRCFFLKLNGKNFEDISSLDWFSLEFIADLVEKYIE